MWFGYLFSISGYQTQYCQKYQQCLYKKYFLADGKSSINTRDSHATQKQNGSFYLPIFV